MIEVKEGNLFDLDVPAYAHGVNCRGLMGAGIAKSFAAMYPAMLPSYQKLCRLGRGKLLGKVHPWQDPQSGKWIFNLFTQDEPGPNASLLSVYHSLRELLGMLIVRDITHVGMPAIGAGIGGLNFDEVLAVVKLAFRNWDGTCYIFKPWAQKEVPA